LGRKNYEGFQERCYIHFHNNLPQSWWPKQKLISSHFGRVQDQGVIRFVSFEVCLLVL
jgi:hypothetical protein